VGCVGIDRPDLVRGSDGLDAIYGRDGDDILKGRGEGNALLGHKGDDELMGGVRQDLRIGGVGDDGLLRRRHNHQPELGRGAASGGGQRRGREHGRLEGRRRRGSCRQHGRRHGSGQRRDQPYLRRRGTGHRPRRHLRSGGSDLIDVQDAAADDKVEYGEGHDTAYFDQELEMVAPAECEERNPIPNSAQGERRAATFGVGSPEEALAGVLGDEWTLTLSGVRGLALPFAGGAGQ
jgi:hypothetical protein